jgi:hypothetical protein
MATHATPRPDPQTGLPIPFTKEQLREDIVRVCLFHARLTDLFTPTEVDWPIAGMTVSRSNVKLWDPEATAEELGLSFDAVCGTPFAQALEQEYEYGFRGCLTRGIESMHYESIHTWIAALLMDLKDSQVVAEWESYGVDLADSVNRCLQTCELANARRTLEGESHFAYFSADGTAFDGLTIRQMALLAGMEEMSVRTAASRQGPNILATFKDEQKRTLVHAAEAKKWLMAKGRYVSITAGNESIDLGAVRFDSAAEFTLFLVNRLKIVEQSTETQPRQAKALKTLLKAHGLAAIPALARKAMDDESLMHDIANLLDLPVQQIALHAKQASLQEALAQVTQQLRAIQSTATRG